MNFFTFINTENLCGPHQIGQWPITMLEAVN
jgi:hypothetical protein